MHGDEEELEAAGEEAEHQQHVAAVAEGLGQRLLSAICVAARAAAATGAFARGVASASDSGMISSTTPAKITSVCCQPKSSISADRERREQELAERAGRRAGAEGERAPVLRQQLAEGADARG